MIDPNELRAAAAALQNVDTRDEEAKIEELEAERERLVAAEAEADRRLFEIRDKLANPSESLQGRDVAKRLLAGETDVISASPSRETLEAERDALLRGKRELSQHARDIGIRIESVRTAARRKLAEAARPLKDLAIGEARQLAEELQRHFATLVAIEHSTSLHDPATRKLQNAFRELLADHGLLPRTSEYLEVAVPAEIAAILQPVVDRCAVAKVSLRQTIRTFQ